MNWYKKAKLSISPEDLNGLSALVKKIIKGRRDWTSKELQLQANFPELLEKMIQEQYEEVI